MRAPCVVFKVCVRMSHTVLPEVYYLDRAPEGPHPLKHHMLSTYLSFIRVYCSTKSAYFVVEMSKHKTLISILRMCS